MAKTFGDDFNEDVAIDKLRLDTECEVQPSLYYYYGKQLAEARTELDEAKDRLKATEAARTLYYRRNPPVDLKATEAVFTALVDDDSEVLKAKEAVLRASSAVDGFWAIMGALDNRKNSLDNLTRLQVSSYYNTESSSTAGRDRLNK